MPTKREREYYQLGFKDGLDYAKGVPTFGAQTERVASIASGPAWRSDPVRHAKQFPKKRKLSAWNKFVKANSRKPRFVLRSGKLNLKKMGVAFRKSPQGKKKKR